jgi:hypothetical protein
LALAADGQEKLQHQRLLLAFEFVSLYTGLKIERAACQII